MKIFNVTVQADRYPMTYKVEASDWSTAAARGLRLWKKRFKGSRATQLKLRIDLLGTKQEAES